MSHSIRPEVNNFKFGFMFLVRHEENSCHITLHDDTANTVYVSGTYVSGFEAGHTVTRDKKRVSPELLIFN